MTIMNKVLWPAFITLSYYEKKRPSGNPVTSKYQRCVKTHFPVNIELVDNYRVVSVSLPD